MPEKNIPFYARWVSKFLTFSNINTELDQDALVAEFLYSLKSKKNITDWQVRKAEEALRLYLHHFRGSKTIREVHGKARSGKRLSDFPYLLKEVKRLLWMKLFIPSGTALQRIS